jgi:hypothetical protein
VPPQLRAVPILEFVNKMVRLLLLLLLLGSTLTGC